jgi:5-methylcytosine-specific restriction endonuclease McrA
MIATTCISCGTRIPSGSRCARCRPARQVNGWAWQALRGRVLDRDGRQCTHRTRDGIRCPETTGLEVHHIVPLAKGGTDDPHNLRTLCHGHHRTV